MRCLSGLYVIDAAQYAQVRRQGHAVVLAGEAIPDREAFFAALAAGLHFPDYFGHNWDAVYDLLTDPGWFPNEGLVLVLNDLQRFAEQHPEQWRIGLQVFQEACAFWLPLGRPLHILLGGMPGLPPDVSPLPPDCFTTENGA